MSDWDGLPPPGTEEGTPHWLRDAMGHITWAWWDGVAWHLGGLGLKPDGSPRLTGPLLRERLGDWRYIGASDPEPRRIGKWAPTIWDWPQNGTRYCAMRGDEVACDERGQPIIVGSRTEAKGLAMRLNREREEE